MRVYKLLPNIISQLS